MIEIILANKTHINVLANLGAKTYIESHGSFIEDKKDLKDYINTAFSISKIKHEINDKENLFYIISVNKIPVGYAKLMLNINYKPISQNSCKLERIYILKDFIPLKLGQQLLAFIESKAKELCFDSIWLSVYYLNFRAIKFYEKNRFKEIGKLNFLVNAKKYKNIVFSKKI